MESSGSEENSEPEELVVASLTSGQGSKENNEQVVSAVFDLEGHASAFSQLETLDVNFAYELLVNLHEVMIMSCKNMKTIVLATASTEDNIHEEGKETGGSGTMTLFPKLLNWFELNDMPNLERFCSDAYSFAWPSSTRTLWVTLCPKLKTLGFAPLSKKLPAAVAENLSDDHVRGREESGGASSSSSSTGSGFGCAPLVCLQSCPSTRNFTQILPLPLNREETPSTQAFDKLRQLTLIGLPMISHIWEKGLQVISGFGNLRLLQVLDCENLRYLFSPHIAKLLTCLEKIVVEHCSAMEKIVGEA
ncbi:hypothetical protein ACE6H2_021283 [Prunus campanulata]